MNLKKQDDVSLASLCAVLAFSAIVVLLTALMQSLDDEPVPPVAEKPMAIWEQCMHWNKWAEWPNHGSCPGDFQARYWRQ